MRDMGHLWICNDRSDNLSCPASPDALPIFDCHEWDGLFSIHAQNTDCDVRLTAWCDGQETGTFKLNRRGQNEIAGKTRVVHAPALIEPDGYAFPAGAYFGAGLWTVQCEPDTGLPVLIKILVRDWSSTD